MDVAEAVQRAITAIPGFDWETVSHTPDGRYHLAGPIVQIDGTQTPDAAARSLLAAIDDLTGTPRGRVVAFPARHELRRRSG